MEDEDEPFYTLKFSAETLIDSPEPNTHILKFKATVCEASPVTGEVIKSIGHYDIWRFNVDAYRAKDGGQLYDMFDADCAEAEALYAAIFDVNGDLRPELGIEAFNSDVIYFQWGRFPNHFKFSTMSLAISERIIDCLGGGCCIAALWPWEKPAVGVDAPSEEIFGYLESQEAHEKHWAKIGFRRIAGTSILIRDLGLKGYDIDKILSER